MVANIKKIPIRSIKKTGDACPENGTWQSVDENPTNITCLVGAIFPHHRDKIVWWKLISYDESAGITFMRNDE